MSSDDDDGRPSWSDLHTAEEKGRDAAYWDNYSSSKYGYDAELQESYKKGYEDERSWNEIQARDQELLRPRQRLSPYPGWSKPDNADELTKFMRALAIVTGLLLTASIKELYGYGIIIGIICIPVWYVIGDKLSELLHALLPQKEPVIEDPLDVSTPEKRERFITRQTNNYLQIPGISYEKAREMAEWLCNYYEPDRELVKVKTLLVSQLRFTDEEATQEAPQLLAFAEKEHASAHHPYGRGTGARTHWLKNGGLNEYLLKSPQTARLTSLARIRGTAWTGSNADGKVLIEFLDRGIFRYTKSNGAVVEGVWSVEDDSVRANLHNATVNYTCTVEDNTITINGRNVNGRRWQWIFDKVIA